MRNNFSQISLFDIYSDISDAIEERDLSFFDLGLSFKKCVAGDRSLPVLRWHVELAPHDPGAVFLGRPVVPAAAAWRGCEQPVNVVVGRHDPQDLRCGKGAFRVQVAPPEDRLDAVHDRHACM